MGFDGKYTYVNTPELIPQIAREIEAVPAVGLDIETTSKRSFEGEIRLIQLSTNEAPPYVLDMLFLNKEQIQPILTALSSPKVIKIIQNARFEQAWFLKKYGLELWPLFDTWRASQIIYNGWNNLGHNLWDIEDRELPPFQRILVEDLGSTSDWSVPQLSDSQKLYAAQDVGWLHPLRDRLKARLIKDNLVKTALIEFGAVLPEAEIENTGIFLDRHRWIDLYEKNIKLEAEALKVLARDLPDPHGRLKLPGFEEISTWNVGSPQKMAMSLRRAGVKVPGSDGKLYPIGETFFNEDGEEEKLGTNEMLLAQVAHKYPVIDKVLTYRGYAQRVKSFGPAYLDHINTTTGRVHTSFYPFTGAGRYSCSGPQLHNIPKDIEYRHCFCAEPGNAIVAADYSGIEMCIVAEISGDEVLTQVFRDGRDAHYATAAITTGKRVEDITKDERNKAKPVNFGLIYGMMPDKLQRYAKAQYRVTLTDAEAKSFYQRYFEVYQGIKRWHARQLRDGPRLGEARTLSGRRRFLAETAHNEFMNTPVQGTGADALKRSLRNVSKRLKKFGHRVKGIVHHVHDEILVECENDPELVHEVETELQAGMKESMEEDLKRVPVKVDPSHGATWGEAKG